MRHLKRRQVGALPLFYAIARRAGLREAIDSYVPTHGNSEIPVVEALLLLSYNLAVGKDPLYELPQWVAGIDRRPIGLGEYPAQQFNDDRFGRALDRLYESDRASLMTEIVRRVVTAFDLDWARIHNDSTTVKAYGAYRCSIRDGWTLERGHSKDHRPDLKQLVFSLSLSADGAVPVHHKVYSGNRTDDTTHIDTWQTLCQITPRPDFLYVADSKVCTDEQLSYIAGHGGRVITIVPDTWGEVGRFKAQLRTTRKAKQEIWRRPRPRHEGQTEYFSVFVGDHWSDKRGYRMHWIYSSEKRVRDRTYREAQLAKAERDLMALNARLNARNLKARDAIEAAAQAIVDQYQVNGWIDLALGESREVEQVQIGPGRPGKHTRYRRRVHQIHTLTWSRNRKALKAEARVDGIFPLLSTDPMLSPKEVLKAYKYQPRLEKRFCQFKSIHRAAPLLFKKIERIEANFFVFFIALILQSLIEREVRHQMERHGVDTIAVYPEERDAVHPTTNKIVDRFEAVSTYAICANGREVEEFKDELSDTQKTVLAYLDIAEDEYWTSHQKNGVGNSAKLRFQMRGK